MPHFDVADGAQGEVIGEHLLAPRSTSSGCIERPEPLARCGQLAHLEAQELLEARADTRAVSVARSISQTPSRVPSMVRASRFSVEVSAASVRLQVGDVDERAGDAQHLAARAVRDIGLLRDPALAAVRQAHAVLAARRRDAPRLGLEGRAAHALRVLRMHARESGRSGRSAAWRLGDGRAFRASCRRQIQLLRWKFRSMVATPAAALRDVERLGFLAERRLEVLALGDVGRRCR